MINKYVVAALAALSALVALFFKGKASGKQEERTEREAQINTQAAEARKEARNVQNEVAKMDDAGIADQLKSKWVRE